MNLIEFVLICKYFSYSIPKINLINETADSWFSRSNQPSEFDNPKTLKFDCKERIGLSVENFTVTIYKISSSLWKIECWTFSEGLKVKVCDSTPASSTQHTTSHWSNTKQAPLAGCASQQYTDLGQSRPATYGERTLLVQSTECTQYSDVRINNLWTINLVH